VTKRVVAFVPDLLFGSNVLGALRAAGFEAELCGDEERARDAAAGADVLVVDLTADAPRRAALVGALRADGALEATRTLGFYSHVEADTRALALESGFDQVVPRSRMAREGPALVARLAGEKPA
jgi:DNA-binding response OmpR family regulator